MFGWNKKKLIPTTNSDSIIQDPQKTLASYYNKTFIKNLKATSPKLLDYPEAYYLNSEQPKAGYSPAGNIHLTIGKYIDITNYEDIEMLNDGNLTYQGIGRDAVQRTVSKKQVVQEPEIVPMPTGRKFKGVQ